MKFSKISEIYGELVKLLLICEIYGELVKLLLICEIYGELVKLLLICEIYGELVKFLPIGEILMCFKNQCELAVWNCDDINKRTCEEFVANETSWITQQLTW